MKTSEVNFSQIFDTEEKVAESALAGIGLRLYPPGTVLVAMYGQGATRGRSAILEISATTNQACAAIRGAGEKVYQRFLFHYMREGYERIRGLGHGSNQANLSTAMLAEMRIRLPPLREQEFIVAMTDSVDARSTSNARELEKLRLLKQGLMDDLLTGRVPVTPLLAESTR